MTGAEHQRAAASAAADGRLELATAHRRAAHELEEAERGACRNVPQEQIAPALHGLDVGRITAVETAQPDNDLTTIGATALVALQGRSLESMGELIRCRASRGAVEGDDADPFGVPGTSVRISPGDAGWAVVEFRASDHSGAEQILRRLRSASHGL